MIQNGPNELAEPIEEEAAYSPYKDPRALQAFYSNPSLAAYVSKLEWKAKYGERDYLTKLFNRFSFEEQLERLFAESLRHEFPLSVVFGDIKGFKNINDKYGQIAGDNALITVSRNLRGRLRPYDAVSRYGGDEFGIALPYASAEDAAKGASRLLRNHNCFIQIAEGDILYEPLEMRFVIAGLQETNAGSPKELSEMAYNTLHKLKGKPMNIYIVGQGFTL